MQFYIVAVLILVCGSLVSLCDYRNRLHWWGPLVALAGAVCAATAAMQGLLGQPMPAVFLHWNLPFASFHLGFDALTCFFMLPVAFICGMAGIYGWGYLRHKPQNRGQNRYWFFYNLLSASLLVVLAARNGMLFLISWEIMSLTSFFLVIHEHEKKEVIKAGQSYLVATHIGTAFLLLLFILLDKNGTMEFSGFLVSGRGAVLVFFLAIAGFGTKAGIIPLHTWLPEAHPAAPSPVSAVMSGVMIKMGIYGILRFITFAESIPVWWGQTLLLLGIFSGIAGAVFGLAQEDIKRFLAYCSIENIGIILTGTGLGLIGISTHLPAVAFLGISGALLHIINHAAAKSTLFFGAGTVLHAAGTKNMEQLGGLIKTIPLTTVSFLTGAVAVCGLPPLNGFISEFLIYMGAFSGLSLSSGWVWSVIAIGSLGLTGVITAFGFTKVFGITFLGIPRSEQAASPRHIHSGMLAPMLLLAVFCLIIGLGAPLLSRLFTPAVSQLMSFPADTIMEASMPALRTVCLFSAGFIGLLFVTAAIRSLLLRRRSVRQAPTWDCGYHAAGPRMQYTASSFSGPLVNTLRIVLGIRTTVKMQDTLFPAKSSLHSESSDFFMRYIYTPLYRSLRWISTRLNWLKKGNTHLFVLYIALVIIALLIWKLR